MRSSRYLIIVCVLATFCSCGNRRLRSDLTGFIGSEVVVPEDMRPTVNGRDTVLTDFMSGRAKMVVWYDSARCASCAISKMYLWADILTYAAQIERKFGVVFLFTPKPDDLHAVRIALMSYKIDYPVFLADQTEFVKLNACLPQDDRMHTFLLDADNKVLLVGNPLRNDKLWKLYEATIRKLLINNGRLSASEG